MRSIFSAFVISVIAFSFSAFAADTPSKPVVAKPAASAEKPATTVPQEVININTADVQALTKLKGIGTKKAEAIVAWRKANGAFKNISQFAEVKGIGEKTLEANRKSIRI